MHIKSILLAAALLVLTATTTRAQTAAPPVPPAPPNAPLPTQLATAHKLFIGNAGDQENADCLRTYNVFYAGIQNLHRFDLVGDPSQADLILELHYEFNFGAGINGGVVAPRQFRVILIDPHTRVILWSLTERTNYAVRQKNRDKNLDQTIEALVNDVDVLTLPTPIAPANHSVVHH